MLNRCAFRQSGFSFMGKFSVELGRSSHLLLFTMMAVPVQLAEMEIGWVLRSAALYYPLVVDVETWSFNSQNG